jgi:hypothetical protein
MVTDFRAAPATTAKTMIEIVLEEDLSELSPLTPAVHGHSILG